MPGPIDRFRAATRAFRNPHRRVRGNWGGYGGRGGTGYGPVTQGGMVNRVTGLGTSIDKTESSFWLPTLFYYRQPLEILGVQSWAARKAVKLQVDYALGPWRQFAGDNESAVDAMMMAEKQHKVKKTVLNAIKAARQYGTAGIAMMTKEAPLDTPLDPMRIRPGDLTALRVLDRYEMSIMERDRDMASDQYGPTVYECYPNYGGYARIHRSRIIRFDGITPYTDSRFTVYAEDWGVSILVPVILPIIQDQGIASEIANLAWEASIPVLGISRLREAITGDIRDDDATPEQIGQQINEAKSNHRLMLVDKGREEFTRVAVQFAGLADMMDKYPGRVASALEIPQTLWMGRSPAGMNATGEGDERNWLSTCEMWRDDDIVPEIEILDQVLARDAGLREPPESVWPSLLEMSDEQKGTAAKLKAEALQIAQNSGWIDEDEGRESIDGDPVFGELPGPAPDDPEPMDGDVDPITGLPIAPQVPPVDKDQPPDDDPDEGAM